MGGNKESPTFEPQAEPQAIILHRRQLQKEAGPEPESDLGEASGDQAEAAGLSRDLGTVDGNLGGVRGVGDNQNLKHNRTTRGGACRCPEGFFRLAPPPSQWGLGPTDLEEEPVSGDGRGGQRVWWRWDQGGKGWRSFRLIGTVRTENDHPPRDFMLLPWATLLGRRGCLEGFCWQEL